jgi:hypothetical protein
MHTTDAAPLADALDGLGAGLFVVEAAGRIVHANASGRAMLRERLMLRAADGRLVACEARAAATLRELFATPIPSSGGPGIDQSMDAALRRVRHRQALHNTSTANPDTAMLCPELRPVRNKRGHQPPKRRVR